jgi:hypothetical protein
MISLSRQRPPAEFCPAFVPETVIPSNGSKGKGTTNGSAGQGMSDETSKGCMSKDSMGKGMSDDSDTGSSKGKCMTDDNAKDMGMTMGKGGATGDMGKAKKTDKREKDGKPKVKLHMGKGERRPLRYLAQ